MGIVPSHIKRTVDKTNKTFVAGILMVSFYVFTTVAGLFLYSTGLYPYEPKDMQQYYLTPPDNSVLQYLLVDAEKYGVIYSTNQDREAYHLLGTNADGMDVFIRILAGGYTYLVAGVLVLFVAMIYGAISGAIIGYYENSVFQHAFEFLNAIIMSIPVIMLILIVSFASNFGFLQIIIGLGIVFSVKVSSVVRGKVEMFRNQDFILAAKEIGLSDVEIIFKHIVWYNCRQELLVLSVYGFSWVIMIEAGLGYLGYGFTGSWISWGNMIYEGIGRNSAAYFYQGIYWTWVPVSFYLLVTILGFNLLGDGLSRLLHIKNTAL